MKRILIIIIGLLMFVNITVLTSCNRNNKKTDTTETGNFEDKATGKPETKTKVNTIIWGALIVSMLANAVFTIILSTKVDEKSRGRDRHLKGKLEELKKDVNLNAHQNVGTRAEPYKLSEADIDLIVDRVLECKRLDERESQSIKNNPVQQQKPQPQTVSIKKLFASAVDANMCFMEVSEQPKDKTIYTLLPEDDYNAKFELYEDAKELVIGCEDYINGACNKLGNGNTIEGCDPGFAQKTSDGFWKVVKKADVKFV